MVRKSFKEVMKDDVNNTFMNVDEFADMHTVDGKEIPVLVDDNEIIEREKKMKSNMDGVYVKQKLIYVKADDFGSLPAIGRQKEVHCNRFHRRGRSIHNNHGG